MEIHAPWGLSVPGREIIPLESKDVCGIVCDSRDEWLELRREGIGSSDVAAILGLNKWKTPYQVWAEKTGRYTPDEREIEIRLEVGHYLEPYVAEKYVQRTGRKITYPGPYVIFRNAKYPHLQVSVDRLIERDEGHQGFGVLEIKTTGGQFRRDWEEQPPPHVLAQLGYQLLVTECLWGSVAVLIDNETFWYHDVEASERFAGVLREKVEAFWQHVEDDIPPAVDGSDTTRKILDLLYARSTPSKIVTLPVESDVLVEELHRLEEERSGLDDDIQALKNQLRLWLADAEEGLTPSGERVTWKACEVKGYTVAPRRERRLRLLGKRD
jgi:putative phage-type endonuclease